MALKKKLTQKQKLARMTPSQRKAVHRKWAATRSAAAHKARLSSVSGTGKGTAGEYFAGSYDKKKLAALTASIFKKYSGKKSVGEMKNMIRKSVIGGSITTNPTARRAGFTVQAEIGPLVAALDQQAKEQGAAKTRELTSTKNTYANLLAQQQAGQQRVNQSNQSTRTNIGNLFDELATKSNAAYDQSEQATRSELERLGLGSASPAALSGIQSDKARAAQIAGQGKTYTQSLADMGSQGFNQLMGLLQGEGRQESTQRQSDITEDYNRTIDLLKSQRGIVRAGLKPKVTSAYYGLQDAANAAKAEAQQQNFLNQLAQQKFNLSQQELGSLLDLRTTQSQQNLSSARKNIIDSLRPTVIR